MTDETRPPPHQPGAGHPADHRHRQTASTDPSGSTGPVVPNLSLDAIIEADPAPPEPAAQAAADAPDLPLPLANASLFVDDPLPDWKADPVLAEFHEALLTLDIEDVTSGHRQGDRAAGTTPHAPTPDVPELPRTPPQTRRGPPVRPAVSQTAAAPPRSAPGAQATTTAPRVTAAPADVTDETDRPLQDEWGVFDPVKCGFAALVARLKRLESADDTGATAPATRDRSTGRQVAPARRSQAGSRSDS
jgi:hypothetical protein